MDTGNSDPEREKTMIEIISADRPIEPGDHPSNMQGHCGECGVKLYNCPIGKESDFYCNACVKKIEDKLDAAYDEISLLKNKVAKHEDTKKWLATTIKLYAAIPKDEFNLADMICAIAEKGLWNKS